MNLSRSTLSLLTVAFLFVLLAAGIGWRLVGSAGAEEERAALPDTEGVEVESAQQFAGAQPVVGVEVVRDTLWVPVVASGQAAASRMSQVATRTGGVVERVLVQENDLVERGDLLIQLDTSEVVMDLAEARSALLTARVEYEERMLMAGDDPLLDEEAWAERERIVRAASGLNQAEVALERAEMEMEWTRVRAPFTGRVADLEAVEGAFVSTGAEVLTLVELDPIRIQVNALESQVAYLQPGHRATVRLAAFPGEEFSARVQSVNPIVDTETRSARVTLVMPNPDHRIRPGMYARVSVDAQAYPDRILVPREAVVERDRREVVFMARGLSEDGTAHAEWRYVTTGFRNDTHVEILPHEDTSLLEPGEIVLVDGHHYLAHDTQVRLVEDVGRAGGRPGR
jgi:membrane fusion protein, multidrug efflux system